MNICLLETFWAPIPGHLLVEASFALFLYLVQVGRYYFLLRKRFHNQTFDIHYKKRNWGPVRVATTTVRWRWWSLLEPIIEYSGKQIEKEVKEGTFYGEFIMNPINLKIGSGIREHKHYHGFNFPKIYVQSADIIFEETSYLKPVDMGKEVNKDRDNWDYDEKFQAYVWVKRKA